MLNRFKTILAWTGIGGVVAYVAVSTYFFTVAFAPYIVMGNYPASFGYAMAAGLSLGLLVGLVKAGFRVYVKGQC